ncbi:hypothetical protein M3J09_008236 [Ascochyta lentis]
MELRGPFAQQSLAYKRGGDMSTQRLIHVITAKVYYF